MNIKFISTKHTILSILLVLLIVSCDSKKVEYTIQQKEINTSDSLITCNASYIEMSSTSPKVNKWLDSINKAVYNNIVERKDTILKYSQIDQRRFNGSLFVYDLTIVDTVYLANDNIISVLYSIYSFTGGAHGMTEFVAYNYDINQMKEIDIKQLFNKDATAQINQLLVDNFKDPYDCFTTKPTINDATAVNFGLESIIFTYEQYILGPYSCGPATIKIPLETIKEYIANPLNLSLQNKSK